MPISRREFIKSAAAASAFMALGIPNVFAAGPDDKVQNWVKGVCRYCGTGCGVMVGVKDGKVITVKGDPNNHNQGLLCLKGALLAPVIYAKDRITEPLVRKDGKLVPVSWDEALDLAASKFKGALAEGGPDAVAYYGSGQALTEETYLANKIFKAGLKSNNVEGNPRLCMASAVGGYVSTFGKDEPMGSYKDIDAATCFFIIGSNTSECHPVLFRRIAARKQNDTNVKIIVCDPRTTNTSRIADLHLNTIAGYDLALLNSMAYVIVHEELDDYRFHSKYVNFKDGEGNTVGFEAYKEFLEEYKPEDVAELCGIPADQIRQAALMFAQASATTSMWCMGINQRIRGVWANNLIHNLHLITGKIGKPGSTPLSLTGQPNACGGVRDTGSLSHLLPAGRLVAKQEHRNQMEELWGLPKDSLNPKPGLHTMALFQAMNDGKVKTLLTLCTNPAQSLPNVTKYLEGMKKTFIVAIEAFGDAISLEYADVVLPPAFWVERTGVYGCTERRYALVEQAIEPPGQCRPSVNILVELAKRIGVDPRLVPYRNSDDVWEEWRNISATTPYNFRGITRERLKKESGILWPCPTEDHPGTNIRYVRGEDPNIPADHPDKYWFYGKPDGKAVAWLRPQKPPAEQVSEEYPFVLTTGRVIDHWHTATMTGKVPEIARSFPHAYVEVNVKDAERMSIQHGDKVKLTTRRGEMLFDARVGDVCEPGLVFVPWFDPKLVVNNLTVDAIDPGSKQPEFKICSCKVEKA
ncbi:molybdopterin oxidoreductase family protein [Oleidesulfovibrio sp.]|uniref:molybdopterin oxidoreductase family protein n=1 Tax=Oleidesulfovibrio sp. TaxID=2909707 RepID=UPI003A83F172